MEVVVVVAPIVVGHKALVGSRPAGSDQAAQDDRGHPGAGRIGGDDRVLRAGGERVVKRILTALLFVLISGCTYIRKGDLVYCKFQPWTWTQTKGLVLKLPDGSYLSVESTEAKPDANSIKATGEAGGTIGNKILGVP